MNIIMYIFFLLQNNQNYQSTVNSQPWPIDKKCINKTCTAFKFNINILEHYCNFEEDPWSYSR